MAQQLQRADAADNHFAPRLHRAVKDRQGDIFGGVGRWRDLGSLAQVIGGVLR